MIFFNFKYISSERPIPLLPTMIRELLKTRHWTLMDRKKREEGSGLSKKVHDEVHEYKAMEEYVCKRYRRGVVKEMVSGIERGN